jgi:hypothetical protein
LGRSPTFEAWQKLKLIRDFNRNLQRKNVQDGEGAPAATDPPDAVTASPSDPAAETVQPFTDTSTTPGTPSETTREAKGTAETLTPNDWKLLRAMKDIGAVDSEHPVSRKKITAKARTGNTDSKHNQDSFDRLKGIGLINAARRVGTWLTPKGLSVLEGE